MPELPDVEVYKKYLDATSLHKTIQAEEVDDSRILHRISKKKLQQMAKVLKTAVKAQVKPERFPSSYLLPHRDKDGRCPHSHGHLKTIKVSGRTAYFCPRCQKQW